MELNWSLQIAEYVDGLFLFGPQMEESDISIRVCIYIYIYLCTCMYVYTYMCMSIVIYTRIVSMWYLNLTLAMLTLVVMI